ncbi:DUF4214 domain-containing protein [Pseudoroseomonas cervicalis]|uniref:DUF4214 domain-containing protein n=1 Tax=Teichococcus cervicalis TaxID=204525 RepID=UPI0022F1487C|nr:DUF4214 domain-containing protein [Pseudoroseomonas cervicalis]WBV44118.1 DUF4214 domain-containing protein [Pseudoroseomonas cervicalis]
MSLTVTGTLPSSIIENNRPGDWEAVLSLSASAPIQDVRLSGAAAALFDASWDPATGTVRIVPAMRFDFEAYNTSTVSLNFGLQARVNGNWVDSGRNFSVALVNVDDTPPHSLGFATGGFVLESDLGGVIGTLQGFDRDTAKAALTYRVLWPDEAYFEIVNGNVLKLRDGVDLLREGGTVRPVMIEVSDGRQEANFLLDVQVLNTTDLDTIPAPPAILPPSPPPPSPPPPSPPPPSPPPPSPPPPSPPPPSPPPPSPPPPSPPPPSPPPPSPPPPSPPPPSPPPPSPPPPSPPPPSPPPPSPPPPSPPPPSDHPPPPMPADDVHLTAEASLALTSSLSLHWQAERHALGLGGDLHLSISSGTLLWLSPADQQGLASGRLALPGLADAQEVLRLDTAQAGHAGGPLLLAWSAGAEDAPDLVGALRGLLGDGAVQTALAGRDGGLLLATLQHLVGKPPADAMPVEFHIAGSLEAPPPLPALPGNEGDGMGRLLALACDTLLGRAPAAGDVARWGNALAEGSLDARGLVQAIMASAEFQALHAGESDYEFVASLYRHVHAEEMDATALGHWVELLASHAIDRADAVLAIGLAPHHHDDALPGR